MIGCLKNKEKQRKTSKNAVFYLRSVSVHTSMKLVIFLIENVQ